MFEIYCLDILRWGNLQSSAQGCYDTCKMGLRSVVDGIAFDGIVENVYGGVLLVPDLSFGDDIIEFDFDVGHA